ncbi:MAG: MaoC/PaaZ C-terminal domain-containing protein [Candidatus Promineifilaceae bacterium]
MQYFEAYEIGRKTISSGRTITANDIETFAKLSGDFNAIHLDETFAQQSPYGSRIAHGLLIQSIATGLASQTGFIGETAVGFRELSCKFVAAVYIGDTVRVTMEVVEKKLIRRLNVGNLSVKFRVITQKDTVVQRGTWTVLVKVTPKSG